MALVTVGAACHKTEAPEAAPLPTVSVVAVAKKLVSPRILVAGVLAPLPGRDVKVGSLVAGRVVRVLVGEGDRVRAGQELALVEAEPLRAHVAEVEAARVQARAQLDNARTRLARAEKLFADGVTARQDVDDARAAVVAAESALKQAEAGASSAEVQLGRATLRAPFDGVVAAILVPAGGSVDGAATPVVEVADTSKLELRAPVPAARVGEVGVGQRAQLAVEGVGQFAGVVAAIAPLVDTATNTVMVRVRVDNTSDGKLRGGMFARGAILGAPREGIAVPKSALLPGDGGAANEVAIVGPDGTVAHRAVVLGTEAGDEIEVSAGLAPGDRVIVAGGYALPDGTRVEIAR